MARVVRELEGLLALEHQALLSGDLEAVIALLPKKEALVGTLEQAGPEDLAPVARALNRNQKLLAAARDGVGRAVTALRQQEAARTTLSTYDSSGKAARITRSTGNTERRF